MPSFSANCARPSWKKRLGLVTRRVFFLRDVPFHKSQVHKRALEDLDYPPYSPYPAPSAFFYFPNLRKRFEGTRFYDLNALQTTLSNCLTRRLHQFRARKRHLVSLTLKVPLAGDEVPIGRCARLFPQPPPDGAVCQCRKCATPCHYGPRVG